MKNAIAAVLILLSAALPVFGEGPKGEITVNINNFRNDKGEVVLALFNSPEGFPDKSEKAVGRAKAKIENGKSSAIFKDIPFGTYAVSIFHDENLNGEMDSNWIGIPGEGVGASNNAAGSFGPPKFKDAKFELSGEKTEIEIKVKYY